MQFYTALRAVPFADREGYGLRDKFYKLLNRHP